MPERREEIYLGDGVYAWYDGYQIWIGTGALGLRKDIALEFPVMVELVRYAKRIYGAGTIPP